MYSIVQVISLHETTWSAQEYSFRLSYQIFWVFQAYIVEELEYRVEV